MRPSVISRSTKKRLQQLAAFLTAVAIIAGFLPLSAVKVSADVQPTEAYPYLFEIWTDGKGTVDFDKNTYPVYSLEDDDRLITACSATKSFTVTVTPEQDEFLDEVVICIDEYEEHNIHLTQQENYSDANLGVSYSEGSLTFTILDESSTEYRGILIFFSGRYQEDVLEENYTLDTDKTIYGGHGARIKNCTLTIGEGGSLTVEAGGNLILEGENADIIGFNKITFNEYASLSFEGGAKAPDGITLYDSDSTTVMNGPFDQWEEFCWDGSKWVRMANPGPANENRIDNDFTVNEDTVIGADASWRIVDSTLTIADGASLTVATGGNLILEGSSTQIVNFAAVTFENGASFSFENNAPIPDGVTLYDGDGTTVMNGPFDAWEEFVMDNGKFVRVMQGPGDEVITIDTPIDDEKVIHSGEVLRIDNCELTLNANLVIEDNGKLIFERNAIIVNPDKISASNGALIAFDKGASVPDGIAIFEPDGVTPITETSFENYEEFRYDGVWKRQESPNPNETIWVDDTELNEDYEIHAGESLRLDDCTLTLNANLIIDDGGLLIFQGGAAIVNPENLTVENGSMLGIDVTAVPDFITVYEADGTTEITDREFDHYEQFIYNDGKWVKDNNPGPGPGPQGSSASFIGATSITDTDPNDDIIILNYDHGNAEIKMLDGGEYEIKQDDPTSPVLFGYSGKFKVTVTAEAKYEGSISMNNQFLSKYYWDFDSMGPGTQIDIEFTAETFILEVEGNLKQGTEPQIDNTNKKITLTYDNGTIEVSGFTSCVENEGNQFKLIGEALDIQVKANTGYSFNLLLDGAHPTDTDGLVHIENIGKDNTFKFEARFDPAPKLVIGQGYTFNSQDGTMTFYDGTTKLGTVNIQGNPFSNPQAANIVNSDISFDIAPEAGYVCYVQLNGNQREYYPGGTYTLAKKDLSSTPEGIDPNSLLFIFEELASDKYAYIELPGEFSTVSGDTTSYKITYKDSELVLGYVEISSEYIDGTPTYDSTAKTTTFKVKQTVNEVPISIQAEEEGITAKLVEYGTDWERELAITSGSAKLTVSPENNAVYQVKAKFEQTNLNQAYITYSYKGEPANIEIGGNILPSGTLNNKQVNFSTPLDPDSSGMVEFKFSVLFIFFMEDLKINGESYNKYLPDTYDELLEAFGSQFTNITVKVPVADSYTIETVAYDAERGNSDRVAVGNFLWFYGEEHEGEDDYVKNAKLEVVQVVVMENGVPVTYKEPNIGTAIEWQERVDGDGNVLNGEAVLPAGSMVTIKLIPDYGTQLVKLGVNGGNFDIDPDNMYYYTFEVGPGNFHLYATFEPVEDVVETSATAVSDGSISLGANSVDNGSAVLFVGDANLDNTTKTSFDNKAATESMEITSYLDISLDKVVYQGVGKDTAVNYSGDNKNVWSEELNDLSSPATVTLKLAEEPGTNSVKVLHETHDGTLEIIDATYDAATQSITFQTSSFSNYAIAYEKNAPVTYYNLWVGGIQVTSANASNVLGDTGTPTVVYDADTNTLTLNGATITGPDSEVLGWNAGGGIVYSGTEDFTIKVTGGTSTVTGGNNRDRSAGLLIADPRYVFSGSSNPCKTTIIIDEGATLTLVGGVPNSYSACSVGLLCDTNGGLTITGSGTLNAAGSGASNIDVSYGIYTQKKLTIDGPTVNASGVDSFVSVGIYSNYGLIIENGTVTTTAGYSARNGAWSYGVMANNGFAINGGTVTAKSYISALNTSVTLGDGVTASGSTNMNGSDAVSYVAADNASYKWFSTTFTPLTYGISLDKTGTYTFTEATVGYSALDPVTVTVTNTGTGATGNLTVALSGSNPGCFTLSKTSLSGIAANGSDTFTIVPNTGLAPATYSTTVTVTGENNISATFEVSFKVNPVMYAVNINGGIADKETAAAGETVTVYADSIPEGKEFDKWVADSDDVVFYNASAEETNFTMPAEDVEITATFKDIKYTVTFNANGHGTAPAAQSVTYGGKATKPADLTATGWTFGGWYTDAACTKAYVFSTAVTGNITLYAKWTAAATPTPTPVTTPTATPTPAPVSSAQLLVGGGQAHVQDIGDTPVSVDPNTGILTIGTTGQGKRLEEILINFENTTGYEGTMMYRVHVQDYGWLPWTEAGNPAGTEGESKRIEAIEIKLTGELAKYYSVEYCVHIQDYGDMQGWVKDGALAGTTGESKRIEEIKVRVVPKGTGDTMSVKYRVHIQDIGWESTYATNGAMSGTSGQSKRLEGIELFLSGTQYGGGIQYKTHVQDIGWESSWAQNGEMSGTQGQAKRLEGISIELYGEVAEYYDIYYRVHAQDIGWMGWAKNGEYAGTAGRSARLEGIQIVLVPKGSPAPGATYEGITAVTAAAFVEGF